MASKKKDWLPREIDFLPIQLMSTYVHYMHNIAEPPYAGPQQPGSGKASPLYSYLLEKVGFGDTQLQTHLRTWLLWNCVH